MNPNAVERDFDGIAVMGHEGRLWSLGAAPVFKKAGGNMDATKPAGFRVQGQLGNVAAKGTTNA